MRWFWLSFVDPDLPEGEQFLGVVVIGVNEISCALAEKDPRFKNSAFPLAVGYAHTQRLNPGGEVKGYEITDDIEKVAPEFRNRLLSAEELVEHKLGRQEEE